MEYCTGNLLSSFTAAVRIATYGGTSPSAATNEKLIFIMEESSPTTVIEQLKSSLVCYSNFPLGRRRGEEAHRWTERAKTEET